MTLDFYTHNMGLGEFANECGRKTDTIADWRKRGMIQGYGQPHPSHDGRWLYAREDAMAVYVSGMLKEHAGLTWASALDAGRQITRTTLMLITNRIAPSGIAYIFEAEGGTSVFFQTSAEEAFDAMKRHSGAIAVAHAVQLESLFNHLPGDYRKALETMQHAG